MNVFESQIKLRDVFEDAKNVYLVLEYVTGGELFDRYADCVVKKVSTPSLVIQVMIFVT